MSVRKIFMKSSTAKTTTMSMSELKGELLKWICERHATNKPLDRKLLRDKAMELATSFGVIGFKCSEAWLTVFLKKHGFSPSLTNCNGPTFPDYKLWIDLLRSLITQYRHRDLFNVDELVMYSDFLPSRTITKNSSHQRGDGVLQDHEISRISSQTKRIGILLCCNSSGTEKLEPLISNPYILEKSRNDQRHTRREASCISDDTFGIWLEKLNTEMSNSRRNILLLLSRERIRSLHNCQRLSNVQLVFLPKEFPTQLRPLRGDIFHCVKMTYRCRYVEFVRNRETTMKEWGTKEIVESIFEAWKDVPQELIVSSFQRTKFREDESFLKIQCPEWDSLGTGMSFRKFVTFDDELSEISGRGIDQEMRFMACANNEHRYNLRKSRRDTVELDDREEIENIEKSRRVRKITVARDRNEIVGSPDREKGLVEKSPFNDQGSLRIEETRTPPGENVEFRGLRISEFSDITRGDKSCENVIDTVTTETTHEKMQSIENREIGNTLTSRIYENPEKRRILMGRCLHGTKFPSADSRPEVSLNPRDFENVAREYDVNSTGRGESEEGGNARSMMHKEKVENFPGEAGPSGKGFYDPPETSGDVNPFRALEFEDEEKIHDDGELRLKIFDAIEICDDINRTNNEENLFGANDLSPGSSKRSRTRSGIDENNFNDDDEPTVKLTRSDGNWSKCYEKNFVFGPEVNDGPSLSVIQSTTNEPQTNRESTTSDKSKINQTGSDEIEKRCVFRIEGSGNLPGSSYPKTKD